MAINLEKGQRINLEKQDGKKLLKFCVGCNWGAIEKPAGLLSGLFGKKEVTDVDLDLSCIMLDDSGNVIDYIYSPDYRIEFLNNYNREPGKLQSKDNALRHSGDDRKGDVGGDDNEDNEIITVDLEKINPQISQIFFFLNNVGDEDFSQIPYAAIRMYEGSPHNPGEVFAAYNAVSMLQHSGKKAMVMGKLYKKNGAWKFGAIGEPTLDKNICETINTICSKFV